MSDTRGEWGNHYEYFLTSLGCAVGLGNIWRFPYVCYENGGGTFLIPYIVCLLLCGLPLYFMEMVLGQYAGSSCTKVFSRLVPVMSGLGKILDSYTNNSKNQLRLWCNVHSYHDSLLLHLGDGLGLLLHVHGIQVRPSMAKLYIIYNDGLFHSILLFKVWQWQLCSRLQYYRSNLLQ